jgi:hypothetical protein
MPSTLQYRDSIRYHRFETTGTGIQRANAARLIRVVVNNPTAASTLTLWESPTTAGEVIANIDCSIAGTYEYGLTLSGLTGAMGGANADVTVIYQ